MLPRLRKGDMVAYLRPNKFSDIPGVRLQYYMGRRNGMLLTGGISGLDEAVEPGRVVKVRRGDRVIYEAHSERKESA